MSLNLTDFKKYEILIIMDNKTKERAIADLDIKRTLFWTLCELDNLIAKETFYSDDVVSSLSLLRNSIEYQMDES